MLAGRAGEKAGRSNRFIGLPSPPCKLAARLKGRSLSDEGELAPSRLSGPGERRLAALVSRGANPPRDGLMRRGTDAAEEAEEAEPVEGVAAWRDCFCIAVPSTGVRGGVNGPMSRLSC